ncbi:MAG: DUF1778 domain-containing protein [Sphingobacteriales bacterium JAD_PAG50586_3]|nr:MAG: DUF1778 domain-containing protein [Sphingobacteriales bacterium JAD_PAG50586_3]
MGTKTKSTKKSQNATKSRFDARIPMEQKERFEYAATIGGFRNLTDFIINTLQEKATLIIKEHDLILASKADKELFFNTILNPEKPNTSLKNAFKEYKKAVK